MPDNDALKTYLADQLQTPAKIVVAHHGKAKKHVDHHHQVDNHSTIASLLLVKHVRGKLTNGCENAKKQL